MVERKFGWKPDLPDMRDFMYKLSLPPSAIATLQDIDLRPDMPHVYDQGGTSSCTGNGNGALYMFIRKKQGLPVYDPSCLFIYYNERLDEGTVNDPDAGAEIRTGIKVMVEQGVPDEKLWPFDVTKVTVKPTDDVYQSALKDTILQYSRVPVLEKNVLHVLSHKLPIVFGITLYTSFMSGDVEKTGMVPIPAAKEQPIGGHCMVIVGALMKQRLFIVRNSWGEGWGDKGHCYIPFDYLLNQNAADDFWVVYSVKK